MDGLSLLKILTLAHWMKLMNFYSTCLRVLVIEHKTQRIRNLNQMTLPNPNFVKMLTMQGCSIWLANLNVGQNEIDNVST